jgi:hypothetical protein
MLELYEAYATYTEIMDLTEGMIRETARERWVARPCSSGTATDRPRACVPSAGSWKKRCASSIRRSGRRPAATAKPWPRIARAAEDCTSSRLRLGQAAAGDLREDGRGRADPADLHHPLPGGSQPLARESDSEPGITDRFELFIGGKELANGFSELNDPEDQAARFRAQVEALDAATTKPCISMPTTSARWRSVAADRRARRRHRPPGDAAHRVVLDPGRAAVPVHAPGASQCVTLRGIPLPSALHCAEDAVTA